MDAVMLGESAFPICIQVVTSKKEAVQKTALNQIKTPKGLC